MRITCNADDQPARGPCTRAERTEPAMLNHEELASFVASCLLGESDRQPLSVESAAVALAEWQKEGMDDLPEGITAQALSDEWNRHLSGERPETISRRYVIAYALASSANRPAHLVTYAAELAPSAEQAGRQFRAKHPDRVIERIMPAYDKQQAFLRYGAGAWTDEESAEHQRKMEEAGRKSREEHEEARRIVSAYSLEEFCREQEYTARRAAEETPNADGVHVGDIFYSCWGYDQTNYDFCQVVALRGKHTAILRENACKAEMCSGYSGYKRPIRDSFRNEKEHVQRTRYDEYYHGPTMKVPELSGNHRLFPVEFGKLYSYSTGA